VLQRRRKLSHHVNRIRRKFQTFDVESAQLGKVVVVEMCVYTEQSPDDGLDRRVERSREGYTCRYGQPIPFESNAS
jgi:hypothetical protein